LELFSARYGHIGQGEAARSGPEHDPEKWIPARLERDGDSTGGPVTLYSSSSGMQ
jgi:hypothetical protein